MLTVGYAGPTEIAAHNTSPTYYLDTWKSHISFKKKNDGRISNTLIVAMWMLWWTIYALFSRVAETIQHLIVQTDTQRIIRCILFCNIHLRTNKPFWDLLRRFCDPRMLSNRAVLSGSRDKMGILVKSCLRKLMAVHFEDSTVMFVN